MTRITARQIKAGKRAEQEYAQLYRRVMRKIRVPVLFRLGIMDNMALGECEDTIDLMEEKGIGSDVCMTAQKVVETMRAAADAFVKAGYKDNMQNHDFYVDMCNHAYGEAEPILKEMRECIERFLNGVKSEDAELKARITVAMLLIEITCQVFARIRKINIARHKVDIYNEFRVFDLRALKEVWDKVAKEHAQVPEMEESTDVFELEGFRELNDKLAALLADEEFVNNQCKWAAAMNKKYMPELFENLRREVEGLKE